MAPTSEMLMAPLNTTRPADASRQRAADLADREPRPAGRPRPSRPYGWVLDTAPPFDSISGLANPAAPVDVRWRAAVDDVRRGAGPSNAPGDVWVRRAIVYLRAVLDCRTEADREQVGREHPDVDAAFRLHAGDDKLARGIVEARLLARQTVDQVATACGLAPGAVEAYEALFFRVADSLDADCYILSAAIGPKHFDGLTEDDVDVILKRLGYLRGPTLVDVAVRYYKSGWSVPARLDGLTRADLEELHLMLQVRTLVLVWTLPFERFGRVFRLQELLGELKALIDSRPAEPVPTCPAAIDYGHRSATRRPVPGLAGRLSGTAKATAAGALDTAAWWSAWRSAVLAA